LIYRQIPELKRDFPWSKTIGFELAGAAETLHRNIFEVDISIF
jgi:hypothetical protein